jgi:predicted translin family RNA/ssDNA-binding protein
MIEGRDFQNIRSQMVRFDREREIIIKSSRDLLKSAKQSIYLVHRNELSEADKTLRQVEALNAKIRKSISKNPKLDMIGAYSAAMQEYVEGRCYLAFVKTGKLLSSANLGVDTEDYLLGLCDLTGELSRRAVACVIRKEFAEVYRIRDMVEHIHGFFLSLDLRNGELRKKSDSIKWNLKKIEDIIYDIKTRGMEKR